MLKLIKQCELIEQSRGHAIVFAAYLLLIPTLISVASHLISVASPGTTLFSVSGVYLYPWWWTPLDVLLTILWLAMLFWFMVHVAQEHRMINRVLQKRRIQEVLGALHRHIGAEDGSSRIGVITTWRLGLEPLDIHVPSLLIDIDNMLNASNIRGILLNEKSDGLVNAAELWALDLTDRLRGIQFSEYIDDYKYVLVLYNTGAEWVWNMYGTQQKGSVLENPVPAESSPASGKELSVFQRILLETILARPCIGKRKGPGESQEGEPSSTSSPPIISDAN